MEFLVGAVIVAVVGWAAGAVTRATISRKARRRAEAAVGGADVTVPCRLAGKVGNGARGFVYGKLGSDALGAFFVRPLHRMIRVPVGGRISRNAHWRSGMQMLQYRTPEGEEIRFLCYEADCDTIVRYLRVPNSADFD